MGRYRRSCCTSMRSRCAAKRIRRRDARSECAHAIQERALLARPPIHPPCTPAGTGDGARPADAPRCPGAGGAPSRPARAPRSTSRSRPAGTLRAGLANGNAAVRRPQMAKQQAHAFVRKTEHVPGQSLLVRTLAMNAQILEPLAHARRMPAIAVAADHELVPRAATGMARDDAAERTSRLGHRLAVFFARCRVAQRLVHEIAAIAHQMPQEDDLAPPRQLGRGPSPVPVPGIRRARARRSPAFSSARRVHPPPERSRCSAVARIERPLAVETLNTGFLPTCQTASDLRGDDLARLVHGPHFRGRPDELANRDAATVTEV